jgi:HAMP domain-containing protein
MSLKTKFILWFTGIGLYVMLLGGVFYYNLFRWTFEEKLKQDVVETVRVRAPDLIKGLLESPAAISFGEYDIMSAFSKDERIVSVVYVGRNNRIRWHKEARFMGIPFDEFNAQIPFLTGAMNEAIMAKAHRARAVSGQPLFELAVPFTLRGEIIGIMALTVTKAGAQGLVASAMSKYMVGAVLTLFLLGLPLYFFFIHYVTAPIEALRERVRYVSLRNPELRVPERSGEIGSLGAEFSAMAEKMRKELEENSRRAEESSETEGLWWRSLLGAIVPGSNYALVVNQDNNVLYANFDLGRAGETGAVHLLDLVDNRQQALLRLASEALEAPGRVLEGEAVFRDKDMNAKILHIGSSPETGRTLILFQPKNA